MIAAFAVLSGINILVSIVSSITFMIYGFVKRDLRKAQKFFVVAFASVIFSFVFLFLAIIAIAVKALQ